MGILRRLGIGQAQALAPQPKPPTAELSGIRVVDEHFTPEAELDIEGMSPRTSRTRIHLGDRGATSVSPRRAPRPDSLPQEKGFPFRLIRQPA